MQSSALKAGRLLNATSRKKNCPIYQKFLLYTNFSKMLRLIVNNKKPLRCGEAKFFGIENTCKNTDLHKLIEKAKESYESNGNAISEREILDYQLSRYACCLIAINGSPQKKAVALAQTYFAVKTRQQELTEEESRRLTENQRRLITRR